MSYCRTFIIDGKCSRCGAEVEDTDKYCHECGKRLHPASHIDDERIVDERHFGIYRRWLDGAKRKDIAEEFGVTVSTVAHTVRYTVPYKKLYKMPDDIRKRIKRMTGIEIDRFTDKKNLYERLEAIRKN